MNEKKNLPNHHEVKKEQEMKSRRHFLKKAVYSAPAVISLGQLICPVNALAYSKDNDWGPGGSPGGGQH